MEDISGDVTIGGNVQGTLLAGRYRVACPLGQGGMGTVWLAEDTLLDNRPVAVKMLPAILVANKRAYNQLKKEALVALKLAHSNIVQLRAFEENGGNPFLVMDYIEGETLDDYLADRETLTEAETVALLGPVAAALDYAHGEGVVHRDVKPANVMIRKDGRPFVLDFGIAREMQETLTRVTGKQSSGTLLYMSPEQLNGASPKAAQDVYSFAAMVYECLTGTPPFHRGQIEYQIVNNPPEPLPEGIGIAGSVMAGLAKDPAARPVSCSGVLGGGAACAAAPGGDATGRVPQNAAVRGPASRGGSEADAIRARVEAKIQQRRLDGIADGEGFAAKKAELGETLLRGEMFFEAKLWGDAERFFTVYATGIGELVRLDGERQAAERLAAQKRVEEERRKAELAAHGPKVGDVRRITLPGGAEMRFRWCPPGSFMMGSPKTEPRRSDDEVRHQVTLTKGFWMGETEVTQKQWKSVMGENPSRFKGDGLPVEQVSWEDCQRFIRKVNRELGFGLRLPTEAEWEYACRAGTVTAYSWGNILNGDKANCDGRHPYGTDTEGRYLVKTAPVGSYAPNAWGFYDMHGNVWEWCADWYGDYPTESVTDSTGPASGVNRVLRGGCCGSSAGSCRSAYRFWDEPGDRDNGTGFRLVCSAGPCG